MVDNSAATPTSDRYAVSGLLRYFVRQGWCGHVREQLAHSRRRQRSNGNRPRTTAKEEINCQRGRSRRTILHLAVTHENPAVALIMSKLLLSHGGCPAVRDDRGRTSLALACSLGRSRIVRYMLTECDVELNGQDADGRTPLAHAVLSGDLETVRLMVS